MRIICISNADGHAMPSRHSFTYRAKVLLHRLGSHSLQLLFILLLLSFGRQVATAQNSGDKKITFGVTNVSLKAALTALEKQSGYNIAYPSDPVARINTVNLPKATRTVSETLGLLLNNTGLNYTVTGNKIVIFIGQKTTANTEVDRQPEGTTGNGISGKVTDEQGIPIAGASIWVKGTRSGTATLENGTYSVRNLAASGVLEVSASGFQAQDITWQGNSVVNVRLLPQANSLDTVTVVSTGYQNIAKERATGSFSVITAKELERTPVANLIQRIEGFVTGVQPAIRSGDNSFLYSGLTQGISSTTRTVGNNDYDVNVRGNTTLQGERLPLIVVDGFPTQFDIKTFNPNDIEQITFLKDAAAASIWGVRAANGVIVINTKKGRKQAAPSVSFTTNITQYANARLNYLPLINSAQQLDVDAEIVNKNLYPYNPLTSANASKYYVTEGMDLAYQLRAGRIDSATYRASVARLSGIDGFSQLKQYLLQPASSQDYNLSVSGGNDFYGYFLSGSYAREVPNAVGTNGERYTITANQSFKLLKRASLEISLKGAFFNYKNNGLGVTPLATGGQTYLPYNQIFDANGNKKYYSYAYYSGFTDTLTSRRGYQPWGYNYLDELSATDRTVKDNNFSGTINLNVPIVKGLAASGLFLAERFYQNNRTDYGPDAYYTRNIVNTATAYNPANGVLTYGIPTGGILTQTFSNTTGYSARGQLTYNLTKGIHQLNALAGTEIRQTTNSQTTPTALYGYNSQRGIGQPVLATYTNFLGNTNSTFSIPGSGQEDKTRRFLSYFSNAAYTLLGKYTLSGSIRYDDYNNFGLDRKYRATPLWSTGLRWNVTRESFLQNVKWLNTLALRATYGYNGNLSLSTYPFTALSLSSSFYTNLPVASISSPANPELRWEKTGVLNLGLDYTVLDSRLSGSIEWYKKQGRDLFFQFAIDPTFGIGNSDLLTRNTASVDAHGFETSVNAYIIRNRNLSWNTNLAFSYNQNKVTDNRFQPSAAFFSSLSGGTIAGYTSNALWVYRNAGLGTDGLTLIYDADGKTKLTSNQNPTALAAIKYAGTRVAPYYGGFSNTIRYKQFSLFAMITYSFGNVFLRPTVAQYPSSRLINVPTSLYTDIDKRWRKAGDEALTNVPGMAGTFAATSIYRYANSDANVLPGDYIRLREVSAGYDLPQSLVNKITAKGIRFNLTARNLGLLWTKNKEGIDPDFLPFLAGTQLRLPPSVSFTGSLSINF